MKECQFTIRSNEYLTASVLRMTLAADGAGNGEDLTEDSFRPGQFVNIRIEGQFLRRPISVCHYDSARKVLTLVYKVVGHGTVKMAALKEGTHLTVLVGLGNGYDLTKAGDNPLLLGGGVGIPPLYGLAEQLIALGKKVTVILGFNTASEVFYKEEFKNLGAEVILTTVDGSLGVKGFVTDALPEAYSYFYTCGPEPMLKSVFRRTATGGQFSFEERMGCGFGACMGCSCQTVTGYKRICKDGPVLEKEEILWSI